MDEDFLNIDEGAVLLRIARDSLYDWVRSGERAALDGYELTPHLRERHGAFVTLRRGGGLRGCIGYTHSKVSLAEAVRDNAINAGTGDPRFPPVTTDELPDLRIEVSALCPGDSPGSPFRRVEDIGALELGADGLYLELGDTGRGGLLLPQVPIEQGWELDAYLDAICRKSGATPDAWRDPANTLYRFRAQVFSETA